MTLTPEKLERINLIHADLVAALAYEDGDVAMHATVDLLVSLTITANSTPEQAQEMVARLSDAMVEGIRENWDNPTYRLPLIKVQ